jgi:hypothetical protein
MGLAVIAGMLGHSAVQAQQCCGGVTPTPVGAARMPEPLPCGTAIPNLKEGPISPDQAPMGPPPELSLPDNHSGAFQCEEFAPECAAYLHLGAMGLMRQRLGSLPIAVLDQQAPPFTGLDTGVVPPRGAPVVLNANQISENFQPIPTLTVGVTWCGQNSLEVTGWYMPSNRSQAVAALPGRLDALFGGQTPFGFSGDNGMWLQDDVVTIQRETQLINAEVNYRRDNVAIEGCELILGARFIDWDETLKWYTGDDDLTFHSALGAPDPKREATYLVRGNNRLALLQAGFDWEHPVWKFLTFGMQGKAGAGADFAEQTHTLTRGDGFVGFHNVRNEILFSQVYDVSMWFDFYFTERCKLRAGYQVLYMMGITVPEDGVNYNLKVQDTFNRNGSVFYSGPMIELQFLF